jgi:prolyl-tRNA synthetase
MKQSELITRTFRKPPRDEESVNARLLEQAGFISKLMAGVYSYLPLGLKVLRKIENIIREEMDAIGAQEVFLPALQPKDLWEKTKRWQGLKEVMYQFVDHSQKDVGLAITHEEVVADIMRRYVYSYKDLPCAVYQIQTKFRHELRPKSGLTRGREFSMKDLYSCHTTQKDCDDYYEKVKKAYTQIFQRMALSARITEASGGTFSKEYSHEFQVCTDAGEDIIYFCSRCDFAQNKEISTLPEGNPCPKCVKGTIQSSHAIEVGNIFKLGTQYSEGVGAYFVDRSGKKKPIVMASYGIGPSRVMGTIVEVSHDDHGIIWPESVSPFSAHILLLTKDGASRKQADVLYTMCEKNAIDVLYDERDCTAGEIFHDADLIGIPNQILVSQRLEGKYEYRKRTDKKSRLVTLQECLHTLQRRT